MRFEEYVRRRDMNEMWQGDYEPPEIKPSSPEKPTVYPLPENVYDVDPKAKNFIQIRFRRFDGRMDSHLTLYIPYGKGWPFTTSQQAVALAHQIVEKEKGKYTEVAIFKSTKFAGRGIFDDNPQTRFTSGGGYEQFKPKV